MRFLKKIKMLSTISKSLAHITVEPSFFFYYSAFVLLELVNTNLYLQKPCRHNATSEPDLETKCDDEKAGITFVADLNAYVRTFVILLMLLYVVFGSYWSDESGRRRRPLLFLPILGQILQCINGMIQSYYWQLPAISAAAVDQILQCLFGGHLVMLIISHVYVCDISSKQDRTMRIGILTALKTICLPVGNGTSGFLLHAFGFFYSYMICLLMSIISLIFGVLLIKDTSVPCDNKITVWQACSIKTFKDSLNVLFKKTLGDKKKIIYVLLCIHVLVWFSSEAKHDRGRLRHDLKVFPTFVMIASKVKKILSLDLLKSFTVEPSIFLYYLSHTLIELINTNLYLQKACRVNATSEPDLETKCDDEKAGVTFISYINTNFKLPMQAIMLFYIVFASSWSDKAGRRRLPLIYLPMFGQLLQTLIGMVQSYFWTMPALWAALCDVSTQAFSGGTLLFRMSTYMYLCDATSLEDRTMRLGVMNAIKSLSSPLANGYIAYLFHSAGFFYSYLFCFVLTLTSVLISVVLIKDMSYKIERKVTLWSIIRWSTITDGFKVVFKKSLGEKRFIVYVLLCLHVLLWFSAEGEKSVLYLYLRYKFNWDEKMYSVYSTYRLIGIIVGTMFCSVFLSKFLKIHDGLIGAFAGFWDTLAVIGFLFATKNWHLYVIPIVDIFHGVAVAVYYSYLSKFYESNEFGRLSSSLNIFSLLIPLYNPVYNILFQKTLDFFPSAFFLVSLVVDITICVLYSITYVLGKKYGT